ncbi:MAG: penicillin-binding protein 2 [Gemmatimonadales bacterium]
MSVAFSPFRLRERAIAATLTVSLLFLVIIGAFFRAQILGQEDFQRRSDQNRLRRLTLDAPRGLILDRNGQPIAENAPGFAVKVIAGSKDSLRATLERMRSYAPIDDELINQVVRRFELAPYQPALVFASAPLETVARLEERRYLLPGLVIRTEPRRLYRAGTAVAHLVGYVAEVSSSELEQGRYPGARPGTLVGKDGLEAVYDSMVRGIEGESFIEVDARGRMVRDETESPALRAVAGEQIRTTIDLDLQVYVDSLWEAERHGTRGGLLAMTPSGEVLALYSHPTFDPNEFIGGISAQRWRQLNNDEDTPLLNRVMRGAFSPGSPFKLVTAAIALKRGLVDFDSRMPVACTGGLRFGNRVFHCWKRAGHGSLDLTGAITASCNIYFYQLGLKIGLPALLEEATRLGLGGKSGLDLGAERSSVFPPSEAYYDRRYGPRGWSRAVTLMLAVGQGENDQSLANMVRFYAAMAGDGVIPTPRIFADRPPEMGPSLDLTPEQLTGLRRAMSEVVSRGTAAASGGRDLQVAGKTGTAQNPHGPDHGWFIAFAPADNPRIVVGSIMEFALHGSSVAPFVVKVIRRYLEGTDPSLKNAEIRVLLQPDSATTASELTTDSTFPSR